MVDRFGDHCLTCSGGGDRTRRHNSLRNEAFHFCASCNLSPELEKPGLMCARPAVGSTTEAGGQIESDPSGRRPADVYLPRWRLGTPAALDFAVTSGLRSSQVAASMQDGSSAALNYEDFRRSHLQTQQLCEDNGVTFLPIVVEASGGGWGPTAMKVWSELAKTKALCTGESESIVAEQLYQSLGLILHRENARAILRRSADTSAVPSSVLNTASFLQSAASEQQAPMND